jgi:hypothetical protein
MTTAAAPSTALATIQPAFTDAERLALAGFLAGYRGLTREAYTLDLRQFTTWCRARSVNLFAVRRADIESFARHLEANGRARPMRGGSSAKTWARRWLICARSATSTGIMAGGASTVATAATWRTNCGMRSKAISTCLMPPGPAIRAPEVSVTGVCGPGRLEHAGAPGP